VPVLLATRALWDSSFSLWRLDFNNCVEEGIDFVNILACGVQFNINEMEWQWFICVALLEVPYVGHIVTFFL
jgi:hypothetical protein